MSRTARIIEVTNPFEPFKDTKVLTTEAGCTFRQWLALRHPGFVEFERPTIVLRNGRPLMRAQWNEKIEPNDLYNIVRLPGTAVQALWVIVILLTVTSIVLALSIQTMNPNTGNTAEGDPVYSLKGQKNQVRLGEPIEVPYGRTRMWPSYAAIPYNKYQNNQQWLFQLFCMGQGEFVIESINIEDTLIGDFQDVEYEVIPPGGEVTLFPDNVVTSVEVSNIELFGPNEPEGSGEYIEDSEGDEDLDIPPTGHYGWSLAGPFVANPSGTQTDKLEFDLSLPRGLYLSQPDGNLANLTVTAQFEARLIDNDGAPLGDWEVVATFTKTLATNTPQRFTVEATVALGRYEVRGARTSNKNTTSQAGNTLQWEQLRSFLPSTRDYGQVTMLAVKARASNNLNDNAASRVNVVAERMLPIYADGVWGAAVPTRNPVWAFCDIFRNTVYGGRLGDQFLDMDELVPLAAMYEERGDTFDWIFDQRLTLWEAAKLIALVGRAVPMLNGTRITMIRNGPKTQPTTIFNQENIVKGSFEWQIKLHSIDAYDALEVEYTDPTTWKSEVVMCRVPGDPASDDLVTNPERIKLAGVTSRTNAYRWGKWKREIVRRQREQAVFATGMEGHIPSYGDAISVRHDVPKWGSGSGFVTAVAGDGLTLTLSEPVEFLDGETYKIRLLKKDGSATTAISVTEGSDEFHVVLAEAIDPDEFQFDPTAEPPKFNFGLTDEQDTLCIISTIDPGDEDTVQIMAPVYRPEPHSHDEEDPPALPDTTGNLPGKPALPTVQGLIVVKSANMPGEVVATWQATRGANYYVIGLSYDGVVYERLSDFVEGTDFRFSVLPKKIYVRVAAVTTGQGLYAYWVGMAPVEGTNIIIDEGLVPDPTSDEVVSSHFGMVRMTWLDPVNVPRNKLKGIHIYWTEGDAAGWDTLPAQPEFLIRPGQQFFSVGGLADNVRKNIWFQVETIFGQVSTVRGPFSATTLNGVTLDHIIVGGIQPVEILAAGAPIPSTNNYYGRTVLLQTNDAVGADYLTGAGFVANKIYRWEGAGTPSAKVAGKGSWTAAVPAVDVTGNLTDAQIASLSAAKLTGQIVSTQITDGAISTPKLAAGAVTTNELAANSVVAAKIGAGEITTSKLAAGAVTTNELAADSVVAGKIAAAAIVASAIGANEVIAQTANIKDGIITSAKIGDAEITNAKIANAAIGNAKIEDLAVTTLKIGDNAVTVPLSASAAGPIVVTASDTETLVSCNGHEVIGSEQVFMIATFQVTCLDNNTHYFRLKRDSTQLQEWEQKMPVIGKNMFSVSWTDTPGAGTYDYSLEIYGKSDNSGAGDSFTKIGMLTLSTKK